jgi:hypothetical protein
MGETRLDELVNRCFVLRSVVVRAAIVLTMIGSVGVAASPASAATTTTITFDDLSPGTTVTNQYHAEGVDFVKGIVGPNVYCYPTIVAVGASLAESGTQVADTSCANGEFPDSSIRGNLASSAENVSVYAGFSPTGGSPASTSVTLTAYDISGAVVNSTSQTVEAGQGTHTLLAVSSSSPNITSFDVTSNDASVSVDNLTFDNPGGVPADFTISPQSGFVQLLQSSQTVDQVTIQRLNGSFGDITFSASGLPAGVEATFSPNPATGDTTSMTIHADPNAPPAGAGAFPSFTVTGTPANAGVGSTPRSASVQVDVELVYRVDAPPAINVPPCSTLKVPITVTPTESSGSPKTVTLTASGLPADDTASFNPSTLIVPGQTHSTLTLTSQSDAKGPTGQVTVTASDGSVSDSSASFPVSRVAPSITSITDASGAHQLQSGLTPQGASPDLGTVVAVHGQGFCPGSTVYFGNLDAPGTTDGPTPDGLGPFGDGTSLLTSVPSLATSGEIYVVPQGDDLGSPATASAPFTIDSYRDTNGFSFENSDAFQSRVGGYSFSDVSDVFGDAATHIDINPCWPFGNCTIVTPIPDPFALLFWGIADASLQGGQCFGFSLASQRLIHGDESFAAFPQQPGTGQPSVWNLQGPDPVFFETSGASGAIAHFIHLMHLEQFSAEAIKYWLSQATGNAINGSQASIIDQVTTDLDGGDHPLIELRNGTEGHVVVAYGVDQTNGSTLPGPGDRVIDVYDPNQEFKSDENDALGFEHQNAMSTSEIVVHPDGHWEFQGFTPEWGGGPGSLVVVPYGVVPVQPTMPTTLGGLFDLLFGSAGATQVTASNGHTLLTPTGDVNANPATAIPDATQLATMSGTPKPGPDIFLFGQPGTYTATVQGKSTGSYHDALLTQGMAASLTARTAAGVADEISVPAARDGVQFGQTSGGRPAGSRATDAQIVVDGSQQSKRTATIATTMPTTGQATVAFTSTHDAVAVTAGGQPMSFTSTLSWVGPDGFPQTFKSTAVHLAGGDRATLTPTNWSSLQTSAVTLRVVDRTGRSSTRILRNAFHTPGRFTIALRITGSGSRRRLSLAARFIRIAAGSDAVLTWELLKKRRLLAHHTLSLSAANLHSGLVHLSFEPSHLTGTYAFRASVELLSPTSNGSYTGQQRTKLRRFRA